MTVSGTLLAFIATGMVGGLLLAVVGVGMALVAVLLLIMTLPSFGFAADQAPAVALATSMAVVAVGALSSAYSHHRLGNIDWSVVGTILPASLLGMGFGSIGAAHLPAPLLRWIFAAFLTFIGIRMLLGKSPATAQTAGQMPAWQLRATGALIGLAGSLMGAGGNVFMVPFLHGRGQSMKRAVATATAIAVPVAILGTLAYVAQPIAPEHGSMLGLIFLPAFVGTGVGSMVSAPAGARLASRVSSSALKTGFAVLLLILAAKMMLG